VLYLADGAVRLRVGEVHDGEVVTTVEVGGSVASRQGLNLPNVTVSLPPVSESDIGLIDAGLDLGVDFFALSFVRRREDLDPVREHLKARDVDVPLIAKIEKPQAAANGEEIVQAADGIMIARGDLGIELPIEEVPLVQKRLLAIAGRHATPTITATQMLESMVHSTRPTRAEVADVANAIFDGTDAVMLSQETAVGKHPVLAVQMMASIAQTTERELPYGRWLAERGPRANNQYHAIAFGAVGAVYQLGLKCIVSPTNTGTTAALISAYRPKAPVLALSPYQQVVRRCQLLWGVHPRLHAEPLDTLSLIDACAKVAEREGFAQTGDKIGITAGLPAGHAGGTNLFKVHTLEEGS
jgi:pyruvate kinase